jgi:hypothetical protein
MRRDSDGLSTFTERSRFVAADWLGTVLYESSSNIVHKYQD